MSQAKAFLVVFFAGSLLSACGQKEEKASQTSAPEPEKAAPAKKAFPVQELLALYDSVEVFPLQVTTKGGSGDPDASNFAFKGKEIPRSLNVVFDSVLFAAEGSPRGEEAGAPKQMFATKKIQISPTTVALLTRVPGFYWPSKLMLFHFDLTTNRATHAYELSDTWGDAGNSYQREAVISKTKHNTYQIKITSGECNPIDDTLSKRHCVDSLFEGNITEKAIIFTKWQKTKETTDK